MDIATLLLSVALTRRANSIPENTAAAAEKWLADHISPANGYALDDTLTIKGAAADAEQVGFMLDQLLQECQSNAQRIAELEAAISGV